jgi:hypothetical protein
VSLDELRRLVQWLLRARGIRCGNETEPAEAVLWLASRVDGVLEAVWDEVDNGALAPGRPAMPAPRLLRQETGVLHADAGGASALTTGSLYLDWMQAGGTSAVVSDLSSPLWLLPLLARRPRNPSFTLWVTADDAGGATRMRLWQAGSDALEIAADAHWQALWGAGARVRLERAGAADAGSPGECPAPLRRTAMDGRAAHAAAHGLSMDVGLWQRMGAVTAAAMVPETALSRARGAGGDEGDYRARPLAASPRATE